MGNFLEAQRQYHELSDQLEMIKSEQVLLDAEIQKSIAQKIEELENQIKNKDSNNDRETLEIATKYLKKEFEELQQSTLKITKEDLNNLSENTEIRYKNIPLLTYSELVKDNGQAIEHDNTNPLGKRLLTVMASDTFNTHPDLKNKSPEERTEYFFRKINTALTRFFENKMINGPQSGPVPKYIGEAIVPAAEIYLLKFLQENGNQNNINSLDLVNGINLESLKSIFDGVKQFSSKMNDSYLSFRTLMNISDFLALPKYQNYFKKLDNPYQLYQEVFTNQLWTQENLKVSELSLEQAGFGFLREENSNSSAVNNDSKKLLKEQLRNEIQAIEMVENPNTAKNILGLIDKTELFFQKTGKVSNDLLNSTEKLSGVEKGLKKFLGINIFEEIKSSKLLSGIMNFVLGLLGFPGGIDGLEKKRRRRNIDKELTKEKSEFIAKNYKDYMEGKREPIPNDHEIPSHLLKDLPQEFLPKFAIDYPRTQKLLEQQLEDLDMLNPSTLSSISTKNFKGKNFLKKEKGNDGKTYYVLDKEKISNTPNFQKEFAKSYMDTTISELGKKKKHAFYEKIDGPDTLAFTLISGLVVDKDNLVEGVKAEAIFPEEFYETPIKNSQQNNDNKFDINTNILPEGKKLKEMNFSEASLFAEKVFGTGAATELLIKLSSGSPSMILRTIALAKHEGKLNFGRKNEDPNKQSGQINIGTFQISAKKNQIVKKRNDCLSQGKVMLNEQGISYQENDFRELSDYNQETANNKVGKAQVDLLVWLGYLKERGGEEIFRELRDENLREQEIITLMSTKIQGGIKDIGEDVLAQINNNTGNNYPTLA